MVTRMCGQQARSHDVCRPHRAAFPVPTRSYLRGMLSYSAVNPGRRSRVSSSQKRFRAGARTGEHERERSPRSKKRPMTWVRDGDAPTNHFRGAKHQSQIKATRLGDTRRRFVGGNETSRRRRGSSVARGLVFSGLSCEGGSVARHKPAEGNTRAAWLVFLVAAPGHRSTCHGWFRAAFGILQNGSYGRDGYYLFSADQTFCMVGTF